MRKVIILCDRCGAEIRGIPKRFCVKEVRDPTSDSQTIVPVGSKVDGMDFCENCFVAVADCMFHWRAPQAKEVKDMVALNEEPVPDPAEKLSAAPEKKNGPAQIYHDEIELYLDQKKNAKWIAEKLNKYGVGYSVALDAVETVKREREEKLVRKIVKR